MKKSLLPLFFTIAVAIGFYSVLTIKNQYATLLSSSKPSACPTKVHSEDYHICQQALKDGDLTLAREIIARGKAEAKDSDEYYSYLVLESKYYFTTMQSDSFQLSIKQLSRYLRSQPASSSPFRQMLLMESKLQHGVYEAKMVGRMDSALPYYREALDMANRIPHIDGYRLIMLTNMADAYKQMGRYDQAVRYARHAMDLGDSIGMTNDTRITIAIGIASAYAAMKSFEQSAIYWEKARQLRPEMDREQVFHYLNNRGNDYYLQEKYEESLQCFLELDSLIANDSTMLWERMYERANLSDVYIKLGQPERAILLLDETQPFFTKQNQQLPLFYLITQRIELALIDGRLTEARQLIEENPIPDWMIPEQIQLRRKVIMLYYKKTGQWQQYGEMLRAYSIMRDSLFSDDIKMLFSETLIHYQHDRTILNKQKEIEEARLSFRWAFALFVASIIVILLLINIIIHKQRAHKLKDAEVRASMAELRMETVRNRITPHFISNALSAEIMAQMEGKPTDLDSLVQLLHRGIELTDVEQSTLSEELEFIRFYCNIESRSVGDDFCLNIDLPENFDTDKVLLPSMSIQILVENANKHGLKTRKPEPGRNRCVLVKVSQQEGVTLVEVIDNGVGLAEDRKNKVDNPSYKERTGLRVMRQTIHLLNEQNQEKHRLQKGKPVMSYGLENYILPDGQHGCRAWLLLPSDFDYILKKKEYPNYPPRK